MMAEIQGLSAGGGGGSYGFPALGDDPNSGPSPLFPGAAGEAMAGRRTMGYLGPGLQASGGAVEAAQGAGGAGGGAVNQNQNGGGAADQKRGGAASDIADLGDPLSPRNREYRRKMIEMDAAHKVGLLG